MKENSSHIWFPEIYKEDFEYFQTALYIFPDISKHKTDSTSPSKLSMCHKFTWIREKLQHQKSPYTSSAIIPPGMLIHPHVEVTDNVAYRELEMIDNALYMLAFLS